MLTQEIKTRLCSAALAVRVREEGKGKTVESGDEMPVRKMEKE